MSVRARKQETKREERRGSVPHILLVETKDRVPSPEAGEMLAGRSFLLHGRVLFSPVAAVVCISLFARGFSPEVIGCHQQSQFVCRGPSERDESRGATSVGGSCTGARGLETRGDVMRCLCGGLGEDGLGPDA